MLYGKDKIQRKSYAAGTIAANGDYTPGTATWGEFEKCDAIANGQASTISFEGGEAHRYTYEIVLDVNTPALNVGDHVRLAIGQESDPLKAREFVVLGFHRYAFMAKAWV